MSPQPTAFPARLGSAPIRDVPPEKPIFNFSSSLGDEPSLDLPAAAQPAAAPPAAAPPSVDVPADESTAGRGLTAAIMATSSHKADPEPLAIAEGMELKGRWRYRLENQLGRGGFGSVYLASCLNTAGEPGSPPAKVALKFFNVPQAGSQHTLVRRELSALLAMKHPRIIRLYDWRVDRSPCFMALEHFPQGSLFDLGFFLGKPLDEEQVVRVMADLLSALNAAHSASILHLDIKPSNVLRDVHGRHVLTDFGISQGAMVGHDVVTTGIGSLGYQSPEQRDYDLMAIGPRTDLWGVGATAWSLYAGLRLDMHKALIKPSGAGSAHGLPPLSEFRPCSPLLEEFIMGLLSIDPSQRPGGAAEALATLRELAPEWTIAPPSTPSPDAPRDGTSALGFDGLSATQLRLRDVASRTTLGQPTFRLGSAELEPVIEGLLDPLWVSICRPMRPEKSKLRFVRYDAGETLCLQDEEAYRAFVLLSGVVSVERDGQLLARESREGTFLGETAALTGQPRTATIRAERPVWALVFNAAELEQFVMANPAVGIRLIKTLALRNRIPNMDSCGDIQ